MMRVHSCSPALQCITFTNKAASEIRSRLATMLPVGDAAAATVSQSALPLRSLNRTAQRRIVVL